ncbi:DNA-binding response regulator [Polaribacter reichenbachii]|uniref:LytR family transcriptional regulator n=1 Tax=Polaribacter reichenbachii TaxID=996801 RepID=A0A1B8U5Y4_9FLAO|nr:response regulator [Polaribacter reichenbachii]APZ46003.1 DNA-binding response regulator [Polaribacter reichenbachii]AUC19865.1 DNA-binding response regulator [Polaribacter reichenbachii]OBY67280.1 LytR family transcriptional regulator [Polaribacter reichenbachii]
MNKIKILVVEDELIIADNICDTLEDLGYEALEPAINYTEALIRIEEEKPDIAILDIQLSGRKTGIDIAKKIRESYNFPFIFLTSNSDAFTLNQAKEVMPPAYLVKPFSKDELYTSIEIALFNFSNKIGKIDKENLIIKNSIFIKEKGSYHKVNFDDILYLKSAHVYIEIILKKHQKIVVRTSLNDIIEKLNDDFIRIHRGYIVNTQYLTQISQNYVKINSDEIPIGKKYKEDILDKINMI